MPEGTKIAQITDGTSNTFHVGEYSWWKDDLPNDRHRSWMRDGAGRSGQVYPFKRYLMVQTSGGESWAAVQSKNIRYPLGSKLDSNFNDVSLGSEHPGGANFLFCDASVHFIPDTVNWSTYKCLASRNGSEPTELP